MKVTIASPIFYEPTASAYFMRAPLDFKPFVAHIIPPRASDPLGNFAPVGVLGVFTAYFGGVSFSPNLDVTSGARIKRRSPRVHVIRDAQGTTCCPGKPLGRPLTAISPLTRSLEGAATLFRTRPLPCHHLAIANPTRRSGLVGYLIVERPVMVSEAEFGSVAQSRRGTDAHLKSIRLAR